MFIICTIQRRMSGIRHKLFFYCQLFLEGSFEIRHIAGSKSGYQAVSRYSPAGNL